MVRRDPRLRQPRDHQQLAQMPGVRAVALGALLIPAPRRGLGRLGQVNASADRTQLLDDKPPARRRLQRDLRFHAAKATQEPRHRLAMRRRDPRPAHLAGLGVDRLGADLPSMLVQSHYDRHTGPPQAPRFTDLRGLSALELRRSLLMPSFEPTLWASGQRRKPGPLLLPGI